MTKKSVNEKQKNSSNYEDNSTKKDENIQEYRNLLSKKYHPMVISTLHDRYIKILKYLPSYDQDAFFKVYEHDFTPLKQYKNETLKRVLIVLAIILVIGFLFVVIDYFATYVMSKYSIHPTFLFHMFIALLFSITCIFAITIILEARNTMQSRDSMIDTNSLVAEDVLTRVRTKQLGRLAMYKKLTDSLNSYNTKNFNETLAEYNNKIKKKKEK